MVHVLLLIHVVVRQVSMAVTARVGVVTLLSCPMMQVALPMELVLHRVLVVANQGTMEVHVRIGTVTLLL
jgi:hypothetical protein